MSSHPPHARCPVHGLGTGPDGRCVICRRDEAPPARGSSGLTLAIGGVMVLTALLVGASAWRGVRNIVRLVGERPAISAEPRAAGEAESDAAAVRLYTTSWCPSCQQAKKWLKAQNIAYEELDVEKNAAARRDFRRINTRGTIPTLEANGEVVIGFNADAYRAAIHKKP